MDGYIWTDVRGPGGNLIMHKMLPPAYYIYN